MDALERLNRFSKDIKYVYEHMNKMQKEIYRLKIIAAQSEIEMNLPFYNELSRRVNKCGLDGEAIRVIESSPWNLGPQFKVNRVYLPIQKNQDVVTVVSNHFNEMGKVNYYVPHGSYVVLENKN